MTFSALGDAWVNPSCEFRLHQNNILEPCIGFSYFLLLKQKSNVLKLPQEGHTQALRVNTRNHAQVAVQSGKDAAAPDSGEKFTCEAMAYEQS